MSAVISVLASDAPTAAIALYGRFDASNRSFLERNLRSLAGDVVIDCTKVAALDDAAVEVLEEFRTAAKRERRRVVIRVAEDGPGRPRIRVTRRFSSGGAAAEGEGAREAGVRPS